MVPSRHQHPLRRQFRRSVDPQSQQPGKPGQPLDEPVLAQPEQLSALICHTLGALHHRSPDARLLSPLAAHIADALGS